MFRCQLCDRVVGPGTRTHKVVTQTREKEYAARGRPPRAWQPRRGGPRMRSSKPTAYDKGGQGREIVQELMVCPDCARRFEQEHPQEEA